MDGLLKVLWVVRASGIGRHGRRRSNAGCVGRFYIKLLPEWRDRRRRDPLRKAFVIDEGDVKHPQSVGAAGRVEVFPSGLHLQHLSPLQGIDQNSSRIAGRMVVGALQNAVVGNVFFEVIWERNLME